MESPKSLRPAVLMRYYAGSQIFSATIIKQGCSKAYFLGFCEFSTSSCTWQGRKANGGGMNHENLRNKLLNDCAYLVNTAIITAIINSTAQSGWVKELLLWPNCFSSIQEVLRDQGEGGGRWPLWLHRETPRSGRMHEAGHQSQEDQARIGQPRLQRFRLLHEACLNVFFYSFFKFCKPISFHNLQLIILFISGIVILFHK